MPLPANGVPWPPKQMSAVAQHLEAWTSWWASDIAGLESAYTGRSGGAPDRPSQYRGGLVGAGARFFWGVPRGDLSAPKSKLHVPIASDICQASADLLFSEPPTITVESPTLQARVDQLADDGQHTVFAEAAEICAAQGGVFLRETWDTTIQDRPFFTSVHADKAVPEFLWGHLRAVTFWTVVRRDDQVVMRHLERHEMDDAGIGVIFHGLYQGSRESLGRAVPLTEDPSTAGLQVNQDSMISTLTPGLAVQYIRNQGPQRAMRRDPLGVLLGRSDLDGIEGLMDALDETYTSWMRDVRLGKARVFVAASMLDNQGIGKGAAWDSDREVYAPLNALVPRDSSGGMPIEAHQFAIRFAEHQGTADQLIGDILRSAGYSAQTFGERSDGVMTTATEVQARERRSFMTRERKVRQWRPAIQRGTEKLLAMDQVLFHTGLAPEAPSVEFGDSVQDSLLVLSQTAESMVRAQAASRETIIRLLHPEWDAVQVQTEVDLISEQSAVADPTVF